MLSLCQMPTPLDAALSHILLTSNEDELPGKKGGEGFISSAYSGEAEEDLPKRWMMERAAKEVGWPARAVTDAVRMSPLKGSNWDWDGLMEVLGRKLVGLTVEDGAIAAAADLEERDTSRAEEREAVMAVYPSATWDQATFTLSIPISGDNSESDQQVILNFIYPPNHPYPALQCDRAPPIYFTAAPSSSISHVPPYVRFHILSSILSDLYGISMDSQLKEIMDSGGQVVFACIEMAEALWRELVVDDVDGERYPNVGEVMKHLLPPAEVGTVEKKGNKAEKKSGQRGGRGARDVRIDPRSNEQVLKDYHEGRTDQRKFKEMMDQRMSLPAWNSREDIVRLVDKNRVVIVVGETGCGKTTQRTSKRFTPYLTGCLIPFLRSTPVHSRQSHNISTWCTNKHPHHSTSTCLGSGSRVARILRTLERWQRRIRDQR